MSDVKYFVGTEEAWKALGKAVQDTYAKRVDNIGDAVTEAAADVKIAADTIVTFDVSSNLNADGSKFEGIVTIAGIAGSVVVKEFDQDVTLNCGIKINVFIYFLKKNVESWHFQQLSWLKRIVFLF